MNSESLSGVQQRIMVEKLLQNLKLSSQSNTIMIPPTSISIGCSFLSHFLQLLICIWNKILFNILFAAWWKEEKCVLRSCQIYPLSFLREEHGVTWGCITEYNKFCSFCPPRRESRMIWVCQYLCWCIFCWLFLRLGSLLYFFACFGLSLQLGEGVLHCYP